jgi:predicted GNAT family N-acyltransferase
MSNATSRGWNFAWRQARAICTKLRRSVALSSPMSSTSPTSSTAIRMIGQIAWVAILPAYRGKGIGWEIMDALLAAAGQRGAARVTLSAQTHAIGFYRLLGFRTVGKVWMMGGIEHITMVRDLAE